MSVSGYLAGVPADNPFRYDTDDAAHNTILCQTLAADEGSVHSAASHHGNKSSDSGSNEQMSPRCEMSVRRQSDRLKTRKRPFSPERAPPASRVRVKRSKRPTKVKKEAGTSSVRLFDRGPDGQPFCCELCKSPYICHPARRGICLGARPKQAANPRYRIHPDTGRVLTLCNACGLCLGRVRKPKLPKPVEPTEEQKCCFLEEAKAFAESLADTLCDPNARVLYCPQYKKKPCKCLQNFIIGDGRAGESERRARHLLAMLAEATRLSAQKCYSRDDAQQTAKKKPAIGLGNGKRKSAAFEEFVLSRRSQLHTDAGLCEAAVQRVLKYSNNFLHKRLKNNKGEVEVARVNGKPAPHQLTPIASLPRTRCCVDNCVMIVLSHSRLLEQWRHRAAGGQMEARRVLAEMLTPSGGARSNCYKFVGWVTGCSAGTIGKVADQMRRTGGDREPPEHGLRHYRRRLAAGGGTAATTAAAAVAENRKESGVETSAIEEQDTMPHVGAAVEVVATPFVDMADVARVIDGTGGASRLELRELPPSPLCAAATSLTAGVTAADDGKVTSLALTIPPDDDQPIRVLPVETPLTPMSTATVTATVSPEKTLDAVSNGSPRSTFRLALNEPPNVTVDMQRQQLWQLQQQQLQLQQQQKLLEFQLLQQHINQINSTQQLQQTQQQQQPEEQRQQVMLQPQQQTAYADNVGIIYCSNVSTRSERTHYVLSALAAPVSGTDAPHVEDVASHGLPVLLLNEPLVSAPAAPIPPPPQGGLAADVSGAALMAGSSECGRARPRLCGIAQQLVSTQRSGAVQHRLTITELDAGTSAEPTKPAAGADGKLTATGLATRTGLSSSTSVLQARTATVTDDSLADDSLASALIATTQASAEPDVSHEDATIRRATTDVLQLQANHSGLLSRQSVSESLYPTYFTATRDGARLANLAQPLPGSLSTGCEQFLLIPVNSGPVMEQVGQTKGVVAADAIVANVFNSQAIIQQMMEISQQSVVVDANSSETLVETADKLHHD